MFLGGVINGLRPAHIFLKSIIRLAAVINTFILLGTEWPVLRHLHALSHLFLGTVWSFTEEENQRTAQVSCLGHRPLVQKRRIQGIQTQVGKLSVR